jgi:hypothetical protein
MDERDNGFLSRWSQRKARVRQGQAVVDTPPAAVIAVPATTQLSDIAATPSPGTLPDDAQQARPAPPTLDDVARLTRDSDYSRFVTADVDGSVRNAALKKLFSDPHFNVMDGLDTYIDDYSIPDPLPPGMLRRMIQSEALGLFKADPADEAVPAPTESQVPDEDPDLRLQPHDAAGPAGTGPQPGEDAGRER